MLPGLHLADVTVFFLVLFLSRMMCWEELGVYSALERGGRWPHLSSCRALHSLHCSVPRAMASCPRSWFFPRAPVLPLSPAALRLPRLFPRVKCMRHQILTCVHSFGVVLCFSFLGMILLASFESALPPGFSQSPKLFLLAPYRLAAAWGAGSSAGISLLYSEEIRRLSSSVF